MQKNNQTSKKWEITIIFERIINILNNKYKQPFRIQLAQWIEYEASMLHW